MLHYRLVNGNVGRVPGENGIKRCERVLSRPQGKLNARGAVWGFKLWGFKISSKEKVLAIFVETSQFLITSHYSQIYLTLIPSEPE